MSFSSNLKEARERNGYTKMKMAKLLDIPYTSYNNYENGREPKIDMILKIARILNVSLYDLVGADRFSQYSGEEPKKSFIESSNDEIEYLQKYRELDDYGKKSVNDLLNNEYERVTQMKKYQEATVFPTIPKVLYGCSPSAGIGNYLPDDISESLIMIPDTPQNRKADYVLKVDGQSMEPKYKDGELVLVKRQDQVEIGEVGIYLINGDAVIKEYQGNYLHSLNKEFPDIIFNEDADVHCMGKVLGKIK